VDARHYDAFVALAGLGSLLVFVVLMATSLKPPDDTPGSPGENLE
jgi:hypothetical protein